MTKKLTEHVVIRDYGKQGLAVFVMDDAARPGNICCWSTLVDYSREPKGYVPHEGAPMCYEEAHVSYYYKGRLVRPDDPRVAPLLKRYKQWALSGARPGEFELEVKVVQRDSPAFRAERWRR